MKILILSSYLPYPPPHGGNIIGLYNLIKRLGKEHKIYLLSFIESETERKNVNIMEKYCDKIEVIIRKGTSNGIGRLKNLLFSRKPQFVYSYYSKEMYKKVQEVLSNNKFDLIHVSQLQMGQYVENIRNIPKLIVPLDCKSWFIKQELKYATNYRRQIYLLLEYLKTYFYEMYILPKFAEVIVCSHLDKNILDKRVKAKISVIPNGIDYDYFNDYKCDSKEEYPSLVFSGSMEYLPNIDAVKYFCKNIYPLIKRRVGSIKFYILGLDKKKREEIIGNNNDGIITPGYVDVRTYLSKCTIFVCPLRIKAGIQHKILDALAMGKPVVSTTISSYGLDITNGENIILADKPEEFADRVCELIQNKEIREKISNNGKILVKNKYNWEHITDIYNNLYEKLQKV